ncbi:MAG: chromate resistance protein [Proteobacteria bacterium]|nr:chromate resistance protein [Pseudomonadota bacterium]
MKSALRSWWLLVLTLPTENATARMRFWRALRAMGCAVLRDGVYVLPGTEAHRQWFDDMAEAILEAGGTAQVLATTARDRDQEACLLGLFDRSEDNAAFTKTLTAARKTLSGQGSTEIQRIVRRLRRDFEALRAADHFPNDASSKCEAAWTDFLGLVDTVLSPDEPHTAPGAIARLARKDYQGRTWATRRHLWVDRVASAWLIRRFIDTKARLLWLEKPSACPKSALGFDFDGARFTHVGERVTFEVLLASFGLDEDPGLARLSALVHLLDVGGEPVPEAAGFEALMTAARANAKDDDALLAQMTPTLDGLHAFYATAAAGPEKKR